MARPRDDDYGRARRTAAEVELDPDEQPEGAHGWPGKRTATSDMSPRARALLTAADSSAGESLPGPMRGRLESSLHSDLSSVQVHTGGASADAASSVGAVAYTTGQHIHFARGQYDPSSTAGEALIAHEVAHTVQQRGTGVDVRQDKLEVSSPGDAHEIEAESFAQSFVAGNAAAVTPVSAGTVSRMVINRQVPNPGAAGPAPGPAVPGPVGAGPGAAVFRPQFDITPGNLAPGVARTQQLVFRGDTLTFRADGCDSGNQELSMEGRVVGEAGAPTTRFEGNVGVFVVVVGNMGVPARPGEAPALVDAVTKVRTPAPATNSGTVQQVYRFKVVADMQWLSDRATTAGLQGVAAYQGGLASIRTEYLKFKAAYDAHKQALTNRSKREQLTQDIVMGILFAAVGGAAGGATQQLIRGSSSALATIAGATAGGDVVKYTLRLASGHGAPGGAGAGGNAPPMEPNPAAGGGRGAAGVEPEVWMAGRDVVFGEAGRNLTNRVIELKLALSEAWAAGRTERMDQDPIDIVAPHIADLRNLVPSPKTQIQYANDLWATWIRNHGYHIVGRANRAEARAGSAANVYNNTDGKLRDDIIAQCGSDAPITNNLEASHQAAIAEARRRNSTRTEDMPW